MRKNTCAGSDSGIVATHYIYFFFFWDNMTVFLWTPVKQWADYRTMHGFRSLKKPAFIQIQAFFTETSPTALARLLIHSHKAAFAQGKSFQPCLPICQRFSQLQRQSNPTSGSWASPEHGCASRKQIPLWKGEAEDGRSSCHLCERGDASKTPKSRFCACPSGGLQTASTS